MGCSRAFAHPKSVGALAEELLGLGDTAEQQRDPRLSLSSAPQGKGHVCSAEPLASCSGRLRARPGNGPVTSAGGRARTWQGPGGVTACPRATASRARELLPGDSSLLGGSALVPSSPPQGPRRPRDRVPVPGQGPCWQQERMLRESLPSILPADGPWSGPGPALAGAWEEQRGRSRRASSSPINHRLQGHRAPA